MKFLHKNNIDLGADCQADAQVSVQALERKAGLIEAEIAGLDKNDIEKRMVLEHKWARLLLEMDDVGKHGKVAWGAAFAVFDWHIERTEWEQAVWVCDTLFHCEQEDSLIALGHGLWLAITFPMDLELTLEMLQYVIDDTPEDSDGAAVAAAVAAYVVELRGDNQNDSRGDAALAVGQMLNQVAREHGNANTPEEFDRWFKRLELDDPTKFLVRMRNVIDVLVQGQWWIDRAAIQSSLPRDDLGNG